jgi:hypothetical protein
MTEAMAELGLTAEAAFIETSEDRDYVLIYTSAKALPAADEALSRSQLPLVREFDQLMADTVDTKSAVSLESIYHTP